LSVTLFELVNAIDTVRVACPSGNLHSN